MLLTNDSLVSEVGLMLVLILQANIRFLLKRGAHERVLYFKDKNLCRFNFRTRNAFVFERQKLLSFSFPHTKGFSF